MNENTLIEIVNDEIKNNHDVKILSHSAFRGINSLEYHGYTWERVLGKFWGGGCNTTYYRISHNGKSINFHGDNDYINSIKMLYRILKTK